MENTNRNELMVNDMAGLDLMEQLKNPTANFYCYDDSHTYKFYGYIATSASTGANSCKALKLGKIYLEFKDGAKYRIYYPAVWISGTMFGKKLFNYKNTLW